MRKAWFLVLLLSVVLFSACTSLSFAGSPTPQPSAAPSIPTSLPEMECQVISSEPTPGPTEVSMFPSPQDDDWSKGSEDAAMTIIEYSDFQCPYCSLLAQDIDILLEKHPDDIRIIFRHFPLPGHPLSKLGAYAVEAAGLQGKFWEMHDVIFAEQGTTNAMTADQFKDWLVEQAGTIGLDQGKFGQDLENQAIIDKVEQAQKFGADSQIPGTPFVLINGEIYNGYRDVGSLEAMLDLFLLEERQYTSCPPTLIDISKEYNAILKTEKGDIVLQLFADKAYLAVNSFVFLAREGWFDNLSFYYVVPGVIAQTGDPSGTGLGGPGYLFDKETNDLKFDKPGVIAMVNSSATTNGSQFFIAYRAFPDLNEKYTIFGEVIDGIDVLESLTARDPTQQMGLPPGDKILSIEIKEK